MPRPRKAPEQPASEIPKPPSAVPAAPTAAVLELQSDIVALVRERSGYRKQVSDAQAELFSAQAKFQATEGRLKMFEQEIGERISLIAQLENRAPQFAATSAAVVPFPSNLSGISSEPTPAPDNDLVNRGHAVRSAI